MSKFLRTAAEVVGAIVAVAAAIPSGGTSLLAVGLADIGVSASAGLVALGTELAVAAIEAFSAPKPKGPVGNPMAWQSDPLAGMPIVIGRAYFGGKIFYRDTWGGKDLPNETLVTAYSIGPINAFEGYYVDGVLTSISGTTANIPDYGFMHVSTQLGAQPESAQLGSLGPPNWTTASKASGLAASSITLKYDTKGKNVMTTEPQCGFVVKGVRVYDPRKDSTYPGGSGAQRSNDETTWSYTGYDNPYLAALAWLIGWRQNGKLVAGVGLPINAIIVGQYVEGANVSDANAWKCGGILDTTDDKLTRLKDLLQAGGGTPLFIGAQVGCLINTPRVSLATISVGDVIGAATIQTTQPTKSRINAIVPRYVAEQSVTTANSDSSLRTAVTWGLVPGSPVIVSDYVTFDGKQRQKQVDYSFVQNLTQSQQLARYDIENAREFGPISLPLKLRWMGYKPGDVVTANLPELGLNGQDILLVARELSPQDMTVTMTARSETYAKHAFALGQTGTPPGTPSVTGPPLVPTPASSAWAIVSETVTANGTTIPALVVAGSADSSVIDSIVFEYRISTEDQDPGADWQGAGVEAPATTAKVITGVQDTTVYQCAVSYKRGSATGPRLILGPVTAGQTSVPWQSGVTGPGKPDDNATVGAPAGTNVASMEAAAVVAEIAAHAVSIDSITSAIEPIPSIASDVAALQTASTSLLAEVDTISVTTIPALASTVSAIQTSTLPSLSTQLAGLTSISVDEQAARRQLIRDTDSLSQTLLRALAEAQRTRQVMSDAGIYIDPASGKARIYAVDQNATTISQVQIALNAVNATIALKASVDFVNAQIAAAVLDPSQVADLTDIYARLTSAELDISGLDATVALKADATTLTGLSGTVTTLSSQLDALTGTVTTKADSTTVTALGTTLSSVQATLAAYGDVSSYGVTIRQALTAAEVANDAGLRALLAGDAAAQAAFTQSAQINSELTTKIVAGLSSEATSRLALAAQMAANQATALSQITTLVTTTTATASSLDALSATVAGQAAEIDTLNTITLGGNTTIAGMTTDIRQARYASDLAADSALRALVAGDANGQNQAAQLASIQFQLTTTIVTGLSSESTARLALTARVATNEAAIVTTNTALATLDAATTTQLAAAESQIGAANARIDTEQTTRATADTANATAITALSSQVNDTSTGLPATRAGLATEQSTRASADSALSTSITNLTAQVNSSSTGLPAALAAVATEATARTNADSALSTSISTLSAQVNDSSTGLPATRASIASEATTRANADSALSTSISGLSATVNDGTTGLAATRSQLATEQTTRSTADTTNATAISTLSSQVNNATTGLPATVAALSTEATTRATADTANATAITSLAGEVHDSSTGLAATRAALATETSARSTADTANATSITNLSGQVNNPTSGLPATAANLATEITARASGDTANSTAISTLSAQVTNNTNGLVATNANLATEVTTRVSGDSANAANISSLSAQVNDATTGLPATRAAVASEATARAGADSANASAISALSGTVGANTASISNLEEVVIDPTGTTARAVMQVDANGNVAGIVLSASNTAVSHIGLVAGSTVIAGTDGSVLATFEEDADGAYIPNLKVDTLKVGTGGSVGLPVTAATSGSHTGTTSDVVVLSTTFHMAAAGSAIVMLGAQQSYSGSGAYNIYVRTDGTSAHDTCQSANGAGAVTPNPGNTGAIIGLAAGDHTAEIHWAAGSAVTLIYANLTIIPIYGS